MVFLSIYLFLTIQLIAVSYIDFKEKKIPNMWSFINVATFIGFLFIFPDLYSLSFETFVFPITWILVGFVLFALKIMGGGDSKYLATFFLLVPQPYHEEEFLCLAYSTIIVGLYVFAQNIFKNYENIKLAFLHRNLSLIKSVFGTRFSYAPVILISWIWFGWLKREMFF